MREQARAKRSLIQSQSTVDETNSSPSSLHDDVEEMTKEKKENVLTPFEDEEKLNRDENHELTNVLNHVMKAVQSLENRVIKLQDELEQLKSDKKME